MPIKLLSEVFVAVLGTTPQVLTECLYYYYSEHYGEKRYFDQIVVITTAAGNKALIEGIISKFRIHDLESELGIPKGTIPFTHADVHQIHDEKGVPLVDIRSTEDNQIATEQIFSIIKSITDDESSRLTATVAGGRKTMSTRFFYFTKIINSSHKPKTNCNKEQKQSKNRLQIHPKKHRNQHGEKY